MRQNIVFFVACILGLPTVASAAPGSLALSVADFCKKYPCGMPNERVRPPLVCYLNPEVYCGDESPDSVKLVNSPTQINSTDKNSFVIMLDSKSTMNGMPVKFLVVKDPQLAGLLTNGKFEFRISKSKIIFSPSYSNLR